MPYGACLSMLAPQTSFPSKLACASFCTVLFFFLLLCCTFCVFLRFLLNTNDTHFWCALEERSINIVILFVSGIALLKVGGRMVYSTCSMNPVENEAVVAEVLIEF
jgi:hypothetical protein